MGITEQQIHRINELARKAKAEGLNGEELRERDMLRRLYIDSVVGNLHQELNHTYVVDEKGNKRKLSKKGE